MPHTHIAIIWASFAWLSSVLALRKRLGKNTTITVFDQRTKFTYIPGLHEAILDTDRLKSMQFDLATYYPEYHHAKITTIHPKHLTTADDEVWTFDYCIIATWSRTNFFWNKKREKYAYKVSYAWDIQKINVALQDPDCKNITVIWWGYTWVEIASAIAQHKREDQHVRVIHSRDRLFQRLSQYISEKSLTWLHDHGVEVIMNQRVSDITSTSITLQDWSTIASDVTIASRWIQANDEAHRPHLTFEKDYQSLETDRIYAVGDVAMHGLITTAHNAMFEWRRIGYLIADHIEGLQKTYPPLTNRDKLAIALWTHDGILTNGKKGLYVPGLIGFAKWIIEKRVLIEFKWRVMLWI
jgi:NADH dehydrogenase FAD-containing subunit